MFTIVAHWTILAISGQPSVSCRSVFAWRTGIGSFSAALNCSHTVRFGSCGRVGVRVRAIETGGTPISTLIRIGRLRCDRFFKTVVTGHARFVKHSIIVHTLRITSETRRTLFGESNTFIAIVSNGTNGSDDAIYRSWRFRISFAVVPFGALISCDNGRFAGRVTIIARRASQTGNSSLFRLIFASLARRAIIRFGSFDAIVTGSTFLRHCAAFDTEVALGAHQTVALVFVWLVSTGRAFCGCNGSFGAIFAFYTESCSWRVTFVASRTVESGFALACRRGQARSFAIIAGSTGGTLRLQVEF